MLTLGAIGGLSAVSMGGSTPKKTQGPPINAQSPDEESFIKYVILICQLGQLSSASFQELHSD